MRATRPLVELDVLPHPINRARDVPTFNSHTAPLGRNAGIPTGRQLHEVEQCARIVYMTTLSVAAARGSLSKIVEAAETTHERFEVTRNGNRVAVLLGADDYDALIETLAIATDSGALDAIRTGLAELKTGDTFSLEDVRADMVQSGRLRV